MAENIEFARIHGLVPLPSSGTSSSSADVERFVGPSYNFALLEGHFVPIQHLGLYKNIFETYGHLYPASVTEGLMPPVLLSAVTMTLDLILEINGSIELSRERVDVWLTKLKFAAGMGLSVTWLSSYVEELDRRVNSSQMVAEARTKLHDLDIRLDEVRVMKAAAENQPIDSIDFDKISTAYAEELKIGVSINSTKRILAELRKGFSGQQHVISRLLR